MSAPYSASRGSHPGSCFRLLTRITGDACGGSDCAASEARRALGSHQARAPQDDVCASPPPVGGPPSRPREGGRLTLFPPVPAKEGRRKNPPSATLQVTGIIGHGDKFAELRRASLLATSRSRPLDRSLPCYRWARVSRPGRSRSALAPAGWGPPDWDELRRRRCYRCSW